MDAKDGLIYALNLDARFRDFHDGKYSPKIQVFTWDGEPVKEYALGNKPITDFTVDTLNGRIYTYSNNEDWALISYYKMK